MTSDGTTRDFDNERDGRITMSNQLAEKEGPMFQSER